jgi:hypothetical protein
LLKRRDTPRRPLAWTSIEIAYEREILRFRRTSALIRINRGAVAKKHQSARNSQCGRSDIAAPEFIFYPELAPV